MSKRKRRKNLTLIYFAFFDDLTAPADIPITVKNLFLCPHMASLLIVKHIPLDYPPKERRKAFVKRNSFIEMAKLHNLSGRITYISEA